MKKLFLSFFLLTLSGCITMGKPFKVSSLPSIETEKTTRQDLEKWIGPPYRTGLENGDRTATWLYYKFYIGREKLTRDLYVRFNADGSVKSYSFNSNFPGDEEQINKLRQ